MAFNQASFFLFPPKYGPVVEFDDTSQTASGKPLEIISTTVVDSTAPEVLTQRVYQWFIERGFSEKERYGGLQVLFRDRCTTPSGTPEVIELKLPLDEDEIEELYIRFLLTEQTLELVLEWKGLVSELGHDFGFRLMDESHRLIPCIDFITVLRENWNFRTFQKNYGWNI